MKCYKVRLKEQYRDQYDSEWWCSGRGRDIWHNLGAVRGALKTSYISSSKTPKMYEIVEFDMVEFGTYPLPDI